jgi:hypothetical protein
VSAPRENTTYRSATGTFRPRTGGEADIHATLDTVAGSLTTHFSAGASSTHRPTRTHLPDELRAEAVVVHNGADIQHSDTTRRRRRAGGAHHPRC